MPAFHEPHLSTSPHDARSLSSAMRWWLTSRHDYLWVLEHHSLRPLHSVVRVVFAINTIILAGCSLLLFFSTSGPNSGLDKGLVLAILCVQVAVVVGISLFDFLVSSHRRARWYFIFFCLFSDLGLAVVLSTYKPPEAALGCAFFAVNSALCVYFLSSRWLLAHLCFAGTIIGVAVTRLWLSGVAETSSVMAGALILLTVVCGFPIPQHFAWFLLGTDARNALRDPLTGLYNRRGVDAAVPELVRSATTSGMPIVVALIDIDDFKSVNDVYGHDIGDEVLRQVAHQLSTIDADHLVVGRIGGEEFIVIVSAASSELERVVACLPGDVRQGTTSVRSVTVSAGAALMASSKTRSERDVLDTAVIVADRAMYFAKSRGGDRVELHRL